MTDTWKESGAMVYVALTVATFSAVLTCCIWFAKKHVKKTPYNPVGSQETKEEEHIELIAEEEEKTTLENLDQKFTFDDSDNSDGEVDIDLGSPVAAAV